MAGAFSVIGLAFSVVQGIQQQEALEEAADEQRKQNAIQNAQQAIERNRAVRQSIAQTRVVQAQQLQAGFQSGTTGAASAAGGDLATAIGAAQTQQAAAYGIMQSQNRQSAALARARSPGLFGTLAQTSNVLGQGVDLYQQGAFDNGFTNIFG